LYSEIITPVKNVVNPMKKIILLTTLLCFSVLAFAQDTKKLSDAQKLFSLKSYDKALPLYVEAIQSGVTDPLANYQAGICYKNQQNVDDQVKGISYFENALKNGKNLPPTLNYDLGQLYLKNEQLDKALEALKAYKNLPTTKADAKANVSADKAIEICLNAIAMMSMPRSFTVHPFASVNSQYTEYNPTVSADESVIAFTALRPNTGRSRSGDKFVEEIYVSYNKSGAWSEPKVIPIASEYNVGTAGISPDGQKMMIFIGGASDPGSLYQITKDGDDWSKPSLLAGSINSTSLETTCSITPDGKTIYFASDRVGGRGGLDIWKTELKDGKWSTPVNLGPDVNSAANEDAPFIHPDQKTLFFTSDGHSTMGGNDIFKSVLNNGKWTKPENMGYPVNTTANDNYFTLLADGKRAYFSSDRKGGQGAQDIYYIDMPENSSTIPLTMVKGKILNAETGKPIPTKMYVIDKESKKDLEFVYDPDPKTGDYLIILPPAKNYDIVIESEGFLPYTLNVNIPNQNYFYELYQQVSLKNIMQFDQIVGQEVTVKNAFYDTQQDVKTDLRKTHEAQLVKNGKVDAYDMMLDLIASGDKEAINYLTGLIEQTDPVESINFDEKTNSKLEVATRAYYIDESDPSKFEQKQVEGKTVLTLPTMVVAEEAKRLKDESAKATSYDKALLNKLVKIFFDQGKSDLKDQYKVQLNDILQVLSSNSGLGIQISGFASAEGNEDANRELSNKRAIAVLDYFNHQGVVRRRIVAKGYGATKDDSAAKEEGRRVEVKVVEVK